MFVLCPECHNHYEDVSQSKKCRGVGYDFNHSFTGVPAPIHEHLNLTGRQI